MNTSKKEALATILLAAVLLLGIANEFISGAKSDNYEKQIQQELILSKTYGETNARWLELSEMLQHNLAAVISGYWYKTVENSGKFKKQDFTETEWEYWKNKPVSELWKHNYNDARQNLRKIIAEVNIKRETQVDFTKSNKLLNFYESLIRISQTLLTILALILYMHIISKK